MVQFKAKVIYNKKIRSNYFEIALSAPEIAQSALPGQFVNIKVSDGLEPLLRRPISIHRIRVSKYQGVQVSEIILLYEVLGKGTQMLSQKQNGEYLDIIGPLGNGFTIGGRRTTPACRQGRDDGRRILVAGGMGTAPLVFLAERLVCGNPNSKPALELGLKKPLVLIGAKTKYDILCEKEFKKLGGEVKIATDDGSRGFKGYVSELLLQILSTVNCELSTIYGCGPKPLLKEISRIAQEHNIPAQLSLESHMACGLGACMGCVIKAKSEKRKAKSEKDNTEYVYKRVCKEGPVFSAEQIIW